MALQACRKTWVSRLRSWQNIGSTRSIVNSAATRPIPATKGNVLLSMTLPHSNSLLTTRLGSENQGILSPHDFLKAIGRSCATKLTIESWEDFWKTPGQEMKKLGLEVRDRRYILWCMEKYRQGLPISAFAHEARPNKTIRGWGPAVQNGKRLRSRRIKNQQ